MDMQLLIRLALRILALALKFALTIVLARSLGFAAVAGYGLALAVSVVSSKILGLGFSTEINRRLSLSDPTDAIREVGRLLLLYCVVYGAIAAVVAMLHGSSEFARIRPTILWGVVLVAFSEHAGLETTSYVFSLHRPRAGAMLLFVRTGAWAGVAIIGLLVHAVRSVEVIFMLWWTTNVITAITACWLIWRRSIEVGLVDADQSPRNLRGGRSVWIDGMPFFVATIMLSGLQYAERFIASGVMAADALGRYVFSWSISNAIQTIAYATIAVTAGPRLIRVLSVADGDFWRTLRSSVRSSACITIIAAAAILIVHKSIFRIAHEPAGGAEFMTLLTLLASFVLRSIADIYWCAAVALRLGMRVAIAVSVVASVSIPLEWLLVTRLGVVGAALAHLMASTVIVILLIVLVMRAHTVTVVGIENRSSLHVS
ncbi:polysaccharide biosynthesis protein [Paraburkholderia nemoris]|uniref:lipopolysaccharide biosynthesis protein n=1 Tax=Paraburkholderia nemoris TaxID=2793076 RepID=UPI0038BC9FEB